jgi:hypothetical protein
MATQAPFTRLSAIQTVRRTSLRFFRRGVGQFNDAGRATLLPRNDVLSGRCVNTRGRRQFLINRNRNGNAGSSSAGLAVAPIHHLISEHELSDRSQHDETSRCWRGERIRLVGRGYRHPASYRCSGNFPQPYPNQQASNFKLRANFKNADCVFSFRHAQPRVLRDLRASMGRTLGLAPSGPNLSPIDNTFAA